MPTEQLGKDKWKKAQASVNIELLKTLADKIKKTEESEGSDEEEEEFPHSANVIPETIEDEAEDELHLVLAKARRLKQAERQFEDKVKKKNWGI